MTLAPTNKAASTVDCMTMHKFIQLYSSKKAIKEMQFKTLICDEMSMTPEVFYKFMLFKTGHYLMMLKIMISLLW